MNGTWRLPATTGRHGTCAGSWWWAAAWPAWRAPSLQPVAANVDLVLGLGPDDVVVATGSAPGPVPNGALSAADVLTGLVTPGEHVVVSDDGVHAWEFDVVLEDLARRGHHVTAVTHQATIAAKGT